MEFTEVMKRRESIRKYDGRKPTEQQLAEILEAGSLGFRPGGFKGNRDHGKRSPVEAMVTRL